VGRAERPLDPDSGPVARFAHDLRELRRSAGSPTYRVLASRTHYSVTALSQAAAGHALPSLAITLAYAEACGGDPEQWGNRWHELAGSLERSADPSPAADMAEHASTPPRRVRPHRRMIAVLGLAVIVASTGAAVAAWPRPADRTAPPGNTSPAASAAVRPGTTSRARYSATISADCPHVAGASALAYDPVQPEWSIGTVGGWTGDGCYGEFFFQRQHGPAALGADYAQWTMRGIHAGPAGCSVSIFIADSPHSAGQAHYYISTLLNGTSQVISERIIEQGSHHGDWVGTGPYPVHGGWLRIDVHAQDPRRREITAGAIHVDCPAD
jgi:hypothetical protein